MKGWINPGGVNKIKFPGGLICPLKVLTNCLKDLVGFLEDFKGLTGFIKDLLGFLRI